MQNISLYTTNITLDLWKYAWKHVPKKPSKLKVIPRIACMQGGMKASWHIHLSSLDRNTHSSIISCVFTTTSESVSTYFCMNLYTFYNFFCGYLFQAYITHDICVWILNAWPCVATTALYIKKPFTTLTWQATIHLFTTMVNDLLMNSPQISELRWMLRWLSCSLHDL